MIENDESDVFVFRRALQRLCCDCLVHVVGSATEARAYLENTGSYTDTRYYHRPELIVSDFRLSGHTAVEFVRWMRADPRFAAIPLVILSGLGSRLDAREFDGLGVERILRKTGDATALAQELLPILPPALFTRGVLPPGATGLPGATPPPPASGA